MKQTLFTLVFLIFSSTLFAQTTQEEYDYLTKGYPEAIEKGYDIKEGYALTKAYISQSYGIDYIFYRFFETETKQTKAFLVEIIKEKKGKDKKRYICIPLGKTDLFIDYVDEYNKLGITMVMGYQYAYAQFTGEVLHTLLNKKEE